MVLARQTRVSQVGELLMASIQTGSIVFIGDNVAIDVNVKAIAVQREVANFLDAEEGDFADYRVFSQPIPEPSPESEVDFDVDNCESCLQVDRMRIISMADSAILQIGSNRLVSGEARVKQFRQLLSGEVSRIPPTPSAVAAARRLAPIAAKKALEM
jgi:spore germination protein PE